MERKTVKYKRTLRGSVGAGVGALFNGNGRRYFILEHKDASKYHKAGESQKIIIDQVELGRDGNCQVRFDDETFPTVSRRHAAIIKEGDKWKLVQLSQTNSTFLNGRTISSEWYLENGDEIQLSTDGPRMGFIVPAGKQSLVSSIKMTERLELFRKQALRPYKTAILGLTAFFAIFAVIAGFVIYDQGELIGKQGKAIAGLLKDVEAQKKLVADAHDKWVKDSTDMAKRISAKTGGRGKTIIVRPETEAVNFIDRVKPSVYAVITQVYLSAGQETQLISRSQGTGFLLNDGRFVTARHCVEPWMFDLKELQRAYGLSKTFEEVKIFSKIIAINQDGKQLNFTDASFVISRSYDSPYSMNVEIKGEQVELEGGIAFGTPASLGNDWAYARTSSKGSIINGSSLSSNLKGGQTVHLLGFPRSLGIADGKKIVDPIYNRLSVARTGLNDGRCIMVNQGVEHGNSGGPVFAIMNGNIYAVGIVSRGDMHSDVYNHLVPMCNLR